MSCRAGSENRHEMRSTSTRSPIRSVFSMDSEGMRYGLTRNAWMSSATAMATTASTTYSRMVRPVEVFLPPLPLLGVRVLGAVHLSPDPPGGSVSERPQAGERPVRGQPLADDRGPRHGAPVAAVVAVGAVVAHDEVVARPARGTARPATTGRAWCCRRWPPARPWDRCARRCGGRRARRPARRSRTGGRRGPRSVSPGTPDDALDEHDVGVLGVAEHDDVTALRARAGGRRPG